MATLFVLRSYVTTIVCHTLSVSKMTTNFRSVQNDGWHSGMECGERKCHKSREGMGRAHFMLSEDTFTLGVFYDRHACCMQVNRKIGLV